MINKLLTKFFAIMVSLVSGFLPKPQAVHAYGGGQYGDVFYVSYPINDTSFATTPLFKNRMLFTVPTAFNATLELVEASLVATTVAIDATDPITVVIESITAAGADDAALVSAVSIKSTEMTNAIPIKLYPTATSGKKTLTAGMSLEWRLTATSPDTAGQGYVLTMGFRVVDRNGS